MLAIAMQVSLLHAELAANGLIRCTQLHMLAKEAPAALASSHPYVLKVPHYDERGREVHVLVRYSVILREGSIVANSDNDMFTRH